MFSLKEIIDKYYAQEIFSDGKCIFYNKCNPAVKCFALVCNLRWKTWHKHLHPIIPKPHTQCSTEIGKSKKNRATSAKRRKWVRVSKSFCSWTPANAHDEPRGRCLPHSQSAWPNPDTAQASLQQFSAGPRLKPVLQEGELIEV